jgi:hypothetical protein
MEKPWSSDNYQGTQHISTHKQLPLKERESFGCRGGMMQLIRARESESKSEREKVSVWAYRCSFES